MLKDERQKIILDELKKRNFVKNNELAELTNSTVQTIISDMTNLHNQNRLIKVYGGAKNIVQNEILNEKFDEEKALENLNLKLIIGQKAAELVTDESFIFIDTGTTTKEMIKYLKAKNLTIVTNGYAIAKELSEYGFDSILLGGRFLPRTKALVGTITLKILKNFKFDFAFLGMNGVDHEGFYTTNIEESLIKEQVIANTSRPFALIDSTKFNQTCPILVDVQKELEILSDSPPNF